MDDLKVYVQVEQLLLERRNAALAQMLQAGPAQLKPLRQKVQVLSAILRGLGSLLEMSAPVESPSATS